MSTWLLCVVLAHAQPPDDMVRVDLEGGAARLGCDPQFPTCPPQSMPLRFTGIWPYEIDRHEVTRGEYASCEMANACSKPAERAQGPHFPVTGVTFKQAAAYCAFVHKRLPTELEWELAARGTDGRMYPWGNEPPWTTQQPSMLYRPILEEVGRYPAGASPYGALDMAGNAAEWTLGRWLDVKGHACARVVRGGDLSAVEDPNSYVQYLGFPLLLREHLAADQARPQLGFRCVRSTDMEDRDEVDRDDGPCSDAAVVSKLHESERSSPPFAPSNTAVAQTVARRGLPFVIFAGGGTLGWAMGTRLSGNPDSRWAIDSAAVLTGELLGALAGAGLSYATLGSPGGDRGWGRLVAIVGMGLCGGLGAIAGGSTGLGIAEGRSGANFGAFAGGVLTLALGVVAAEVAGFLNQASVGETELAALPWLALVLGGVSSASMSAGTFAMISR
jgi:hypothetical protein